MTLFSEYRIEVIVNWTESKSFLAGQFPHLYQKKGCHEKSYLFSSYQVKIGCIFQKKKHVVFSSKYFDVALVQGAILYWAVFSYQIQERTVNRVFHNFVFVQGALCSRSTSFSDENYIMILFLEYRIEVIVN